MACSKCGEVGHKKPNCPITKEENERDIDRAIDILQVLPPIITTPLAIAGIWLLITKFSPRINSLNNVIALGELIPTIDLGLPKGIVLGAMIDKTSDVISFWNEMKEYVFDFPIPDIEDLAKAGFAGGEALGTIGRNPIIEQFFPFWSEVFKETDKAVDIAEEEYKRRLKEGTLHLSDDEYLEWQKQNKYKTYADGDTESYDYD